MTMSRAPGVRRESIRVALSATIVVAVAYVLIAAGIVAFATITLTSDIASRLGLAIGDAIVRATGGRWSVGASPLGGARFAVSWPRGPLG